MTNNERQKRNYEQRQETMEERNETIGNITVRFGKYRNGQYKDLTKIYAIWFLHNITDAFLYQSKGCVYYPIKEYLQQKFNITVDHRKCSWLIPKETKLCYLK